MIEKKPMQKLTLDQTNTSGCSRDSRKPIKSKRRKKRSGVMNMFHDGLVCVPMVIGGALHIFAFPADQSFGARFLAVGSPLRLTYA